MRPQTSTCPSRSQLPPRRTTSARHVQAPLAGAAAAVADGVFGWLEADSPVARVELAMVVLVEQDGHRDAGEGVAAIAAVRPLPLQVLAVEALRAHRRHAPRFRSNRMPLSPG